MKPVFCSAHCLAAISLMTLPVKSAEAQTNLGFESSSPNVVDSPPGWRKMGVGYGVQLVSDEHTEGEKSIRITYENGKSKQVGFFQTKFLAMPNGASLDLSADVKTSDLDGAGVGLFIAALDSRGHNIERKSSKTKLSGDTNWSTMELSIELPSGTVAVGFGVILAGEGTGWVDNFSIRITEHDSQSEVDLDASEFTPAKFPDLEDIEDRDFAALAQAIGDARVVYLGESIHGSREFTQIKSQLVEYLHRHMGFSIVAFESGYYECNSIDDDLRAGRARQAMDNCVFPGWRSQEMEELFAYIQSTYNGSSAGSPLRVAGIDVQTSSVSGVADRPAFLRRALRSCDDDLAGDVYAFDQLVANEQFVNPKQFANRLQEKLEELIEQNKRLLAAIDDCASRNQIAGATSANDVGQARRIVWGTKQWLLMKKEESLTLRNQLRETGMADNLSSLLRQRYADSKIIVWTANSHSAKSGENIQRSIMQPWKSVAEIVADTISGNNSSSFSIGFFADSGVYFSGDGKRRDKSKIDRRPRFSELFSGLTMPQLGLVLPENQHSTDSDRGAQFWVLENGAEQIRLNIFSQFDAAFYIPSTSPATVHIH